MAVPADVAVHVRGGLRSLYLTGQEQRGLRDAAVAVAGLASTAVAAVALRRSS